MQTDPTPDPEGGKAPRSEPEPLMDRRVRADRRKGDRRKQPASVAKDRRRPSDRRTTARRSTDRPPRTINQYDVTAEEMEFINAVIRFRQRTGNRFPKARDILQILKDLGYRKQSDP